VCTGMTVLSALKVDFISYTHDRPSLSRRTKGPQIGERYLIYRRTPRIIIDVDFLLSWNGPFACGVDVGVAVGVFVEVALTIGAAVADVVAFTVGGAVQLLLL
jgi:hypothetical protein